MEQIPSSCLLIAFGLCFLLFLKGSLLRLFLLLALLLLTLLGRREQVAESRMRLLVVDRLRWSCYDRRHRRRLELGLQRELELEVIENDEFEFLANGCAVAKLEPRSRDTVQAVIKRELEPRALGCQTLANKLDCNGKTHTLG